MNKLTLGTISAAVAACILAIALVVISGLVGTGPNGDTLTAESTDRVNPTKVEKEDGFKRNRRPGARMARMLRGIELTDEQRSRLRSNTEETRRELSSLREQVKAMRAELRKLRSSKNPDLAEVEKIAAIVGDFQAKRIVLRFKMRTQISQVLTDEQWEQLQARRKKMRKKMKERRARWAERRGGKLDP